MNNFHEQGDVNPRIEFVKVEPNYLEDDGVNEREMEDSNEIQRIIKFAPNIRAHGDHNPIKKKIIRVQYYSKHNRGLTVKKFRPTVPAYKEDIAKRRKKMTLPVSREQTIALIKRIKMENCIWDSTCEDYKNKKIKDKAWNRVAVHVGLPVEMIRAKWVSTLGSYRSTISRHKKGLSSDEKPRWFAYNLLSFLGNEMDESVQSDDSEFTYEYGNVTKEKYEAPETPQSAVEQIIPQIPQGTVEYLEEALSLPETAPTIVNRIAENNATNEESDPSSCNEEILRIVRSMSKVLNKMANIGMAVDYGRYVNQHLKEYDDEIRRKTVKAILDLITAADEEMSKKYPDRSQIPGSNVAKSHHK